MNIREIAPKELWNFFEDLNAVPRPSKKEDRVIEFMKKFGKDLGLEVIEDSIRNVIIKKSATKGMEDKQTVILQSHLDMVHQKNADTIFDFDKEGIKTYIEDGFLKAEGTTLGADNGIGVASIMAVLASREIEHPAIEALFTIDEETGMTGAINLDPENLLGTVLLNLDTEEDDELDIGCAGGIDTTITGNYSKMTPKPNSTFYQIKISGLKGGHSGMDIIKGLGNANKLMNRVLLNASENSAAQIHKIDGGSLRNAIPRESYAILAVKDELAKQWVESFEKQVEEIYTELKPLETNLEIVLEKVENAPATVMDQLAQEKLLMTIQACFNGVFAMSKTMDIVETSSNLARVLIQDGEIHIGTLQRSSLESGKWDVAAAVAAPFKLANYEVEHSGDYPGWQPDVNAEILKIAKEQYVKMYKQEPKIVACHAGLECGILKKHLPNTEMISFGPNIYGAHSPTERVEIKSVQKYWDFFLEILKNIPEKK